MRVKTQSTERNIYKWYSSMPPKFKSRKRVSEDSASDNDEPKSKRTKSVKDKAITTSTDISSVPDVQIDKEGCEFWPVSISLFTVPFHRHRQLTCYTFVQISKDRRIQITKFKGNHQIAIREYYEKDGQMLPGKKVRPLSPMGPCFVLLSERLG